MRRVWMLLAVPAVVLAACGGSSGSGAAHAGFSATIDNPWLPMRPGTTLIYRGTKDGQPQRDVVRYTGATRTVDGVPCTVVDDRVYSKDGKVNERTSDYYTQDSHGNVWYYGEDTAELNAKGKVTSTEGTWHAGVNGGRAGLFMPARPRIGEQHLQEYLRGHAEDHFRVVSLAAKVNVPYRRFAGALETHEWTPLEPGTLDAKYYVRGIGEVFEGAVKGPKEVFGLVAVRHS